ncbi:hypothetical protein GOBAR_AA13719 [Gossypium barbadense]|uniref:Uncharacterized protein n=1 Tax=Gossypium barbadense TaxID=3634 RepID=A0A2P5XU94_GOSBA|nr:hypothetical protein GOBAR_AA13719 [Gossypium barbadense]
MGDVSGNWCEPDINHLPSNNRGVRWREIFVDAVFCSKHCNPYSSEGSSGSYHPDMGGSSLYHPDMGGSSSYHLDIGGSSLFDLEQPPTSVDMFGNNMYSTPPQATIDPVSNPSDVYNRPQRPPRQRRPLNRYTSNNDTTPGSFQF